MQRYGKKPISRYYLFNVGLTKVDTQFFFVSPQIANPQICIDFSARQKYKVRKSQIAKGLQIKKKILVRKFTNLRFAELIFGPPAFEG
jgi:hypothetical protein